MAAPLALNTYPFGRGEGVKPPWGPRPFTGQGEGLCANPLIGRAFPLPALSHSAVEREQRWLNCELCVSRKLKPLPVGVFVATVNLVHRPVTRQMPRLIHGVGSPVCASGPGKRKRVIKTKNCPLFR